MFLFKKKVKPIEKKEERIYEIAEEQLKTTHRYIILANYDADVAYSELMEIKDRIRLAEATGDEIDPYVKTCLDKAIMYAKSSREISDLVLHDMLPKLRG